MPNMEYNATGALDYQEHPMELRVEEYLQTLGVLAVQALCSREWSPY